MSKFVTTQSEEMYLSEDMVQFHDNLKSLQIEKTLGDALCISILGTDNTEDGLCLNKRHCVELSKFLNSFLNSEEKQ